jgi:hypothetical protein
MRTHLLRCFLAVLLVLALLLPFAAGQPSDDSSITRGVKLDPAAASDQGGSGPSALPYFVMVIYALGVLTIVCMPSRKA